MIKEIYVRNEKDPNFQSGIIDFTNDIEEAITQLRMILDTKPGDVLGLMGFGVDLERYIFNTRLSAKEIEEEINQQISNYMASFPTLTTRVKVSFGDSGYGYDFAVVDIYLNGDKALGILVDKQIA